MLGSQFHLTCPFEQVNLSQVSIIQQIRPILQPVDDASPCHKHVNRALVSRRSLAGTQGRHQAAVPALHASHPTDQKYETQVYGSPASH